MIIYGHRGAAAYAPENTMSSFFMGLQKGSNGLETDIQKTKDGILVLFHDDSLKRILNKAGKIQDFTFNDLCQYDYGVHFSQSYIGEKIVTLQDFLYYFSQRPINLALEIKQTGIGADVLDVLKHYTFKTSYTITSFEFDNLIQLRSLNDSVPLGYLTKSRDDISYCQLHKYKIEQLCLHAKYINKEIVCDANSNGISIRAWGVKDISDMENCVKSGVMGMTIDFPDVLVEYLKSNN